VVGGRLAIDMGGFLLRTPDRAILVDLGVGDGKQRPNPNFHKRSDDWLPALARTGTDAERIDTVVFTHLHIDHVGYATTRSGDGWAPTFPAATHLVTQEELAYWDSPSSRAQLTRLGDYIADSVRPLERAGVLAVVPSDHEISEEVRLFPSPGHTPGNVCVEIRSRGERAVFSGDMIHHAIQLAFPQHSTDYCVDEELATRSRLDLLESMSADDLLFPAHFPGGLPGRVRPDGAGGFHYEVEPGEVLS
jgi:glyoxylase-like metal-dependent hydrolase (beta-lactamase superfamily II)